MTRYRQNRKEGAQLGLPGSAGIPAGQLSACLPAGKDAGGGIGDVIERLDRRPDSGGGVFGDRHGIVQHPADRSHRHIRRFRDLADRDRHSG